MTVIAEKAIKFQCEGCGKVQYHDDSLEFQDKKFEGRWVRADHIQCDCGHDNHVIVGG